MPFPGLFEYWLATALHCYARAMLGYARMKVPSLSKWGYLRVIVCYKAPLQQLVICEPNACSAMFALGEL